MSGVGPLFSRLRTHVWCTVWTFWDWAASLAEKDPSCPINDTLPQRSLVLLLRNIPTRWKPSRFLLLPFNVVLKCGRHVSHFPKRTHYVSTLAFVSKNTPIPVPRVTTAIESKSGPDLHILLQVGIAGHIPENYFMDDCIWLGSWCRIGRRNVASELSDFITHSLSIIQMMQPKTVFAARSFNAQRSRFWKCGLGHWSKDSNSSSALWTSWLKIIGMIDYACRPRHWNYVTGWGRKNYTSIVRMHTCCKKKKDWTDIIFSIFCTLHLAHAQTAVSNTDGLRIIPSLLTWRGFPGLEDWLFKITFYGRHCHNI